MGVINLGLLVDKIKKKLESAGFIKNTDYATASAAGVVKIGEGLSITDAGVLSTSGGSLSAVTLYEGDGSDLAYTFPAGKTMDNYSFLVLISKKSTDVGLAIVPTAALSTTAINVAVNFSASTYYTAALTKTTVEKVNAAASMNLIGIYAF